ncbi:uncharacterized protein H6S33_001416 [Morchella sextelata]|uniref:uncharacterized protein n=1 Tax=Morchella sextelata TaxID=1174677 RepID=UPI001D040331|nr:uncharacterized protein H6S33_001416 [Morchella sextelata]KAH0609188.1 hypothetical protein H6S33_001416 [Morchella sextelata]
MDTELPYERRDHPAKAVGGGKFAFKMAPGLGGEPAPARIRFLNEGRVGPGPFTMRVVVSCETILCLFVFQNDRPVL